MDWIYVYFTFIMDWGRVFFSCLVLLITHIACLSELSPPQRINVVSSVVKWEFPGEESNVTYKVQYNTSSGDWLNVCICSQHWFNFTAAAEDFYGKHFRVRAESENKTSDWLESEQVQCVHIDTCAPQINLKVETDTVRLWMKHRDQSLKHKNGGHIIFRPFYWKTSNPNDTQEPDSNPSANPLVLQDLESGQKYCFRVVYLVYNEPYGKPSRKICEVIPETSAQRKWRIILSGILIVLGFVILGFCFWFVYAHYKRVKTLLQPPLEIPEHFQEFFSREFSWQTVTCHTSQVSETCEFITLVEFGMEEDESDAGENVCSPAT